MKRIGDVGDVWKLINVIYVRKMKDLVYLF